jgi:hypothetical protein
VKDLGVATGAGLLIAHQGKNAELVLSIAIL